MNTTPITFFGSIIGPSCLRWSDDNRISILNCEGLIVLIPKYHYPSKPFNIADADKAQNEPYPISSWLELKLSFKISNDDSVWNEETAKTDPYIPFPSNTGYFLKAEWSPAGLRYLNRCILSVINHNGELLFFEDLSYRAPNSLKPDYCETANVQHPENIRNENSNSSSNYRFTTLQWSYRVESGNGSSQALLALGDNHGVVYIYSYTSENHLLELKETFNTQSNYITNLSWSQLYKSKEGQESCVLSVGSSSEKITLINIEVNPFSIKSSKIILNQNPSLISSMKFLNIPTGNNSTKLCYATTSIIHLLEWDDICELESLKQRSYDYNDFNPISDIIWNEDLKSILFLNHLGGLYHIQYDASNIQKIPNQDFNDIARQIQSQLDYLYTPKTLNDQGAAENNENDTELEQDQDQEEDDLGQSQNIFPMWYGLAHSPTKGQIALVFEWSSAVSEFIPHSGSQSGLMILPVYQLCTSEFSKWMQSKFIKSSTPMHGGFIEDLSYLVSLEPTDNYDLQTSKLLSSLLSMDMGHYKNWLSLYYMFKLIFPSIEWSDICKDKFIEYSKQNAIDHLDTLIDQSKKIIHKYSSYKLSEIELKWVHLIKKNCQKFDIQYKTDFQNKWSAIIDSSQLAIKDRVEHCPICSEEVELKHPKKIICSKNHIVERCSILFNGPIKSSQLKHTCVVCKSICYQTSSIDSSIQVKNKLSSESSPKRRKTNTQDTQNSSLEPNDLLIAEILNTNIAKGCTNCGNQLV